MVSSLSTLRGLMLPTVGGDAGIWGGELNSGLTGALDNILAGTTTLYSSNGVTVTLTQAQAQNQRINCISSSPMAITLAPANFATGAYIVTAGSNSVALQTPTPGTITIVGGLAQQWVYSDGINVTGVPDGLVTFNSSNLTSTGTQLTVTDGVATPVAPSIFGLAVSAAWTNPLVYASKNGITNWQINSSGESVGRTDANPGTFVTGATSGTLGEMITFLNSTGKGLSNSALANIGSIVPGPGIYLAFGSVTIVPAGGGLCSFMQGGIGQGSSTATAANITAANLSFSNSIMGSQTLTIPPAVITTIGSTAINLVCQAVVSAGTITGTGRLNLLRIR